MSPLLPRSSIAKKLVNGATGLGLFLFILIHLIENLLLLAPDPLLFNSWAHFLQKLGPLLIVIELGLLAFFLAHVYSAVMVTFDNLRARPTGYRVNAFAGKPSRKTGSSQTMIVSGLVLLGFVVWHVWTFRFGPGVESGYVVQIDGEMARDLHRLVAEFFSDLWNVTIYVAVMVFLGFHLRHGFWSMFQTLGAFHPRYTPLFFSIGIVVAVLLAVGFIVIPIWMYTTGGVA